MKNIGGASCVPNNIFTVGNQDLYIGFCSAVVKFVGDLNFSPNINWLVTLRIIYLHLRNFYRRLFVVGR